MLPGKSLIDQFLGPQGTDRLRQMAGNVTGQASQTARGMDGRSLATGALAGGLAGLLLSGGSPKKLLKGAVQAGGVALIGGLAYKAYSDWQAGKAAQPVAADAPPPALPAPDGTAFLPSDPAAADSLSLKLVRAMVAAAKADGHVTASERRRILAQLPELGLGDEAQAIIASEIEAPLDPGAIAALAATPEEAAEIYAASLLVVDPEAPAEAGYLALLAARLRLDPQLVQHLHAGAGAVTL